ncbi:MAG: hypothetical protein WCH39_24605 [Schlesneria sp.]
MTDAEAETSRVKLILAVTQAERLLRRYSITDWADTLNRAATLITGSDFSGVDDLFSIFGGMGSFNDIVIHPLNGNPIEDSEIDRVNNDFQSLKTDIYEIVTALRRYQYAR